jgi:hypothetical protein
MAKMMQADELPEVTGEVRGMMRAYQKLRLDMVADLDIRDAREAVIKASHLLQDAENRRTAAEESYRTQMAEIEARIIHAGLESFTQSFEWAGVVIRFKKGGEIVSWKGTILKELVDDLVKQGNIAMAELILTAQSITPRMPSIEIEE